MSELHNMHNNHSQKYRPLSVREYARIQTFPDSWQFAGNLTAQYKQIGNAVPVNLAWAVSRSLIRLMNRIEQIDRGERRILPFAKRYRIPQEETAQAAVCEPAAEYGDKRK